MPPEAAPAAPVAAPVVNAEASKSSDNTGQPSEGGQNSKGEMSTSVSPPPGKTLPTAAEMFDVMMNGKAEKWSKEKVLAHASKSAMADKKFEEAAQLRKENETIKEMAKKNPMGALAKLLGVQEDELRDPTEKWYNEKWIEPESLTEEQRELKRFREDAKVRDETAKEQKDREDKEIEQKLTTQHRDILQKQIIENLEGAKVVRTAFFAARAAFYMGESLKHGWEAPKELIMEQVRNEQNQIFGQLDGRPIEEIIEIFPNLANRIRTYDLKQLRESRGKISNSFTGKTQEPTNSNERPRLDMTEVNERLRRMKQGDWG